MPLAGRDYITARASETISEVFVIGKIHRIYKKKNGYDLFCDDGFGKIS